MDFALDVRELRERIATSEDGIGPSAKNDKWLTTYTADDAALRRIRYELTSRSGLWGSVVPSNASDLAPSLARHASARMSAARCLAVAAMFVVGLVLVAAQMKRPPATDTVASDFSARNALSQKLQPAFSHEENRKPVSVAPIKNSHALVSAPGSASLEIQVQHHFREAELSVWIDGKLLYSHSLQGQTKSRLALFRSVQGPQSANLRVAAGLHRIRVQAQSSSECFDESKTILGDFEKGDQKTLEIAFKKRSTEMRLVLK
jgi:hypothetical protein